MPFLIHDLHSFGILNSVVYSGSTNEKRSHQLIFILKNKNTKAYTLKVNKSGFVVDQAISMNKARVRRLGIYSVQLGNGVTENSALLKGYQKSSIFINQRKGCNMWNGYYEGLSRPWVFSPNSSSFASEMWKDSKFSQLLWNTFFYAATTNCGSL